MTRRLLASLPFLVIAACTSEPGSTPNDPGRPSFLISDGAHSGGNPDFFFLTPMVSNPNGSPNWDGLGNNPHYSPTVTICGTAATNEGNAPAAVCVGTPTTFSGSQINASSEAYSVNWKVPNSPTIFYRITVTLGTLTLGFADVETGSAGQIKNVTTGDFVPLKDGTTLPLRFTIETHCTSNAPCGEKMINLAEDNTIFLTDGGNTVGGVHIPPQSGGGTVNITLTRCGNLPLDIPLFGSCIHIDTHPEIIGDNALTTPAQVFVCDANAPADALPFGQHDQVTLHRTPGTTVQALPHALAFCPPLITQQASLKGFLAAMVHGQWKAAGRQLVGLVAPRPLYARRLDQGAGGAATDFSDFQFALPAKLVWRFCGSEECTPGPYALDLFNNGVANAKVHFNRSSGGDVIVITGASGFADVPALGIRAFGAGLATQCAPASRFNPFIPYDGETFSAAAVTLVGSFLDVVNPPCGSFGD